MGRSARVITFPADIQLFAPRNEKRAGNATPQTAPDAEDCRWH
jgi:hypothetical protein